MLLKKGGNGLLPLSRSLATLIIKKEVSHLGFEVGGKNACGGGKSLSAGLCMKERGTSGGGQKGEREI